MKKMRVVDLVDRLFQQLVNVSFKDYELVDVQFVKEGKRRFLRVFIDKPDGVTIDDCAAVSRALNEKLDQLDPIEANYILEVSSPGVERPLKKPADFERFSGKLAQLKLYHPLNGTKVVEGELVSLRDDVVTIQPRSTKETIQIPYDKIANAKLLFDFSQYKLGGDR